MFLRDRRREDELMDQPGLSAELHRHALRGLRRVNAVSRTSRVLWTALSRVAGPGLRERSWRILDLASGGGEVAAGLSELASAEGVGLSVDGWDRSGTAVRMARDEAERRGARDVRFLERDALSDPIDEPYDVVLCSLFLHHLEPHEAEHLLRRMSAAARVAVLVDDLRRSRTGWAMAWLGSRLLSRSRIVHVDGPRSVQGAFTEGELSELARRAGLAPVRIDRHWPQRMLLTWTRP